MRLYDSIRKDYPIGAFLTLEASNRLNLSPRLFEGVAEEKESIESYVLDGQQRITAGLALYKGVGSSHYFLNLGYLWDRAVEVAPDIADPDVTTADQSREKLRALAEDLDEDDKYLVARRRNNNPIDLVDSHLLWTAALADNDLFGDAKERYLKQHPNRRKFLERFVDTYFKIGIQPTVPLTELDEGMPIEAITRVFATLNTSGQRLTPVEIVVAVLYSHGIHLRQDIEEFKELSAYYRQLDANGELLLQTVALLERENPKRSLLPKTITHINYRKRKNDAIDALDRVGEFLTNRLGAGLDHTGQLIPYPAILPPLGIALAKVESAYSGPSHEKARWHDRLERWFVGTVIGQRYIEAQPTTQARDERELADWIDSNGANEPSWLKNVRVGSLDTIKPSSAIGKLISMLISRKQPKDPLNKEPVGGTGAAIVSAHGHHIFPKAFVADFLGNGGRSPDSDLALNVMPITGETNRRWAKMNPSDQVKDVKDNWPNELTTLFDASFVDTECLELMQKQDKTQEDYLEFINKRGKVIQNHLASEWDFLLDSSQLEDDEEAE